MLQYPFPIPSLVTDPLVEQIVFLAKVLESVPIRSQMHLQIFHGQILQSSQFSAKIEGNTGKTAKEKKEIANCEQALRAVKTLPPQIDTAQVLRIHSIVMHGIDANAGKLRTEQSGVFDTSGTAVHVTPDRKTLEQMMTIWITEANKECSAEEQIVNAIRLHYYFEKMHPFIDGNGRTGRVLLQWCLRKSELFGENILPIDVYFDAHRGTYYAYLEQNTRRVENFVRFCLEGMIWSLEQMLHDLRVVETAKSEDIVLLPRREELVAIIGDHPLCSFDFLSRRFVGVPVRTLAYDLAWLVQHGFVKKHGKTRGVRYSAGNRQFPQL